MGRKQKKKAKKKARGGTVLSRHGKPMGHIPTQLPNFPPVYRGRVIKSRAKPSLRQTQQLMGGPTMQNLSNPVFFGNTGMLSNGLPRILRPSGASDRCGEVLNPIVLGVQ